MIIVSLYEHLKLKGQMHVNNINNFILNKWLYSARLITSNMITSNMVR